MLATPKTLSRYASRKHFHSLCDSAPGTITQVDSPSDYGTAPVTGIEYKTWDNLSHQVTARIYVLAAHAVENAKILLSSPWGNTTVANSSDQVGRNLADHPISLVYGITDEPVYGYRGPLSTSGIESLRDGAFRQYRGAFRMEIGNDGWTWPHGDPYTTPQDFLNQGLYGKALADAVAHRLVRQTRIGCLTEQLPNKNFCVELSDKMDVLGIPRPKLTYGIDEYGQRALSAAVAASIQVFRRLIANPVIESNYTEWLPDGSVRLTRDDEHSDSSENGPPNIFVREGWAGAGHLMGTHRMGSSPNDSVVNLVQQSWDHPNLYLLGSGNWPSYATGNPTLTIAALALRAGDAILAQLRGGVAPAPPTITSVAPGPGQITINVDTPDTGGGPIVRFDMTPTSGDGLPQSWCADPPLQYESLLTDETYTITVTATNAAGFTSQPSAPTAPASPLTVLPGAPTAISLVPDDIGGSLILTFRAPSYVGAGPITHYNVYVTQGLIKNQYSPGSAATECRFPTDSIGDRLNVPVSAKVSASNGWGDGPYSESLQYPS